MAADASRSAIETGAVYKLSPERVIICPSVDPRHACVSLCKRLVLPPFANNAKDGAPLVVVVPAKSKAGPPAV